MNNPYILVPGLLILGIGAGVAIMHKIDRQEPAPVSAIDSVTSKAIDLGNDGVAVHPMANAFMVSEASDSERIETLEQQILLLSERIEQLEQNANAAKRDETVARGALATTQTTSADTQVSGSGQALTTGNLVKSGVDEAIATEIVRRKNEIELQRLELRDRATREGYLGTSRYRSELNTLQQGDLTLRDEIGDDAYDRYLFTTGQDNRVNIASVMQGSAADQAGIKPGDVILNYADSRLFNWNELQKATTLGVRGEYVNVTVMRNGQVLNLWLPRGPLGVRLSSGRLQP